MTRIKWIVVGAALACGGKDGPGSASSTETSSSTLATTAETTGSSSGAATGSSSGGTSSASTGLTTGVTTSASDSGSTSAGTGTSEGTTTGGTGSFVRFRLSAAAGPCPPDLDCDGFTELLASGLLRVEVFGDVTDTVVEMQVSPEDLAASIPAFTDPALLALLDQPEPLCDPPTDIFEQMLAEVDGVVHDATTTTCDQPPLAAARAAALALRMKYVP